MAGDSRQTGERELWRVSGYGGQDNAYQDTSAGEAGRGQS